MSHFIGSLVTRYPREDGGELELVEPFGFHSEKFDRDFIVPAGFKTDLASVPRIPVAYMLYGGVADEPAVIHDYLYQTRLVSRADADAVLLEACEVAGVPWWRRYPMYLAVRIGGSLYYDWG